MISMGLAVSYVKCRQMSVCLMLRMNRSLSTLALDGKNKSTTHHPYVNLSDRLLTCSVDLAS